MRVPGKESDFWLFPFGLSFLIARLFDKYVRRWASRTRTRFGKTLVDALHGPRPIFLPLLGGPRILLGAVELTPRSGLTFLPHPISANI